MTRPNLRQIAQELGLSVTTVSRALKDGPEVHPDTRARVHKEAMRAGYAPNVHGLALRTGRTHHLTFVLPLETSAALSDIAKVPLIEGMTLAARQAGYMLSIASISPDEDQLAMLARLAQSGMTDGLVITRMRPADPRLDILRDKKLPFVCFGQSDARSDYPFIDIDNHEMGREAAAELLARGRRRIALQLLSRGDLASAARLDGLTEGLAQAGLRPDPGLIGHDAFTMEESAAFFGRLLDLPQPPDGFVCANELGLLGALHALRQRGLQPGQDVDLVSRDSTGMSAYLAVPVIRHRVDMAEVGRLLVEALIARIEHPGAPVIQTVLRGRMLAAGETG